MLFREDLKVACKLSGTENEAEGNNDEVICGVFCVYFCMALHSVLISLTYFISCLVIWFAH